VKGDGFNFAPGDIARLARLGNVVPLCREIDADLLTPVAAWLRLMRGGGAGFLLESIEGGETLARYSFLGRDPVGWIRVPAGGAAAAGGGGPIGALRRALAPFRPVPLPDLPRFTGGAVGYASYDVVRAFERLPGRAPAADDLPDLLCGVYDTVVAFDHLKQRIQIVSNIRTEENGRRLSTEALRVRDRRARARIADLERRLRRPMAPGRRGRARPGRWRTTMGEARYRSAVRRARSYIHAGDIFQVVLSQRLDRKTHARPFDVYRALRRINPSPYMFHLQFAEASLSGASPEMLVRVEGDRVRTRPIAGTRPRGRDEQEDGALERVLRADPKECAEHVMLVDLGRNDLGRVCRPGSVALSRFMQVERFSHVMHLVSEVEGRLRPGHDAFHAFEACFPAGTVTGAPKVRAMQIIDELETTRRGPYGGAVFYADWSGNLDSCLTIRTVLMRDGVAHLQAGAGIVADSRAAREYGECMSKARALVEAVERAEAAP
jgi:anthranilate synthase component 1